jgi:hypothetical protein
MQHQPVGRRRERPGTLKSPNLEGMQQLIGVQLAAAHLDERANEVAAHFVKEAIAAQPKLVARRPELP